MAAVDGVGLNGTPVSINATEHLDRHPKLLRDFQDLDQAIELLPKNQTASLVASYRPFVDILYSRTPPTWPQVRSILIDIFGELDEDKDQEQEVPLGVLGIQALRESIGRAIGSNRDVGAVKHWLDLIERSVYHTRDVLARNPMTGESILRENGAASSRSRSGSTPVPPIDSTPSTRRRRAATPSPDKVKSSPPLDKGQGRAIESENENKEMEDHRGNSASQEDRGIGSSSRVLRSRSSTSRPQYEEKDDEDPIGSPLSSLANSEGEDQARSDSMNDEERPRKKPRRGEGEPTPTRAAARETAERREMGQRPDAGVISPETLAKETAVRDRFIARMPATSLSPEEWLVREAFPSIPAEIELSPPSTFDLPIAHSFKRSHLTGNHQYTVYDGIGSSKNEYDRLKNNLCLLSEMNLCCFASDDPKHSTPFRPGQPIVFTSHAQKCLEVVEAISTSGIRKNGKIKVNIGPKKDKPFIHLFVQAATNDWRYMGDYVVAWNGSDEEGNYQPLDPPSSTIHKFLKVILQDHATSNNQGGKWPGVLLRDWNFQGRNWVQAEKELESPNDDGKEKRHVKYLVLKCIGWDETSFKEWSKNRAEKKGGKERTKKGTAKNGKK